MDVFIPIVAISLVSGLIWWAIREEVRKFGWQGFFVKCALQFNYIVVSLIVIVPQMIRSYRNGDPSPSITPGSLAFLAILGLITYPLLLSDRAVPWLLRPFVKWPLYVCFAISWLAVTGASFGIVCAHLAGRY